MRNLQLVNDDWNFYKNKGETEIIQLPHTWNAFDGQDGGDDYYRGIGTYTRTFFKPELVNGQRFYVEFRGVNSIATVKINGEKVAVHNGGYSTFRVDLTDKLQKENLLEVVADNSRNDYVYPQKADFTFYGGIYRDVYFITVEAVHFDLDYFGGNGFKITPSVNGKNADIKMEAFVKGKADRVLFSVPGLEEKAVPISYEGGMGYAACNMQIENVHLWDGVDDPYCYDAKAELIVNEETIDTVDSYFGCRNYRIDSEQGFILNGRNYPLHGVSRHQDRRDYGNALTKKMHEEDLEIIIAMGANAIRLAHYQHDQYFYELCDRKGIIMWAEIPYISEHLPKGRENTISQMKELIVQNYNHPGIICWALSNEISLKGVTEDMIENHIVLNNLAHKMDPTRVTAVANLFMLETDSQIIDIPDVRSYNLYYGWYVGELEQNDEFFDEFHGKYPDKAIGLSEYGADANYIFQSANPVKGDFTEQYQSLYHEHMLEMFSARPYIWSTFVWNMFDFGADARNDAGDCGVNHKGLVSFDRKVKKDSYYIYKAWWSKEPFVHLCGSRYVDRLEEKTEIKVYSNQNKIALYVNGILVDEKEGNHVFTFNLDNIGKQTIEAKSGSISDKIVIRKVEKPNPEYTFESQSDITNWFLIDELEIKPGCYSIKDTLGDISKSQEGAVFIMQLQQQMAQNSSMASMAEGVVMTEQIQKMMMGFTVESLLKQAGGNLNEETVKDINKQLTKIKRVD